MRVNQNARMLMRGVASCLSPRKYIFWLGFIVFTALLTTKLQGGPALPDVLVAQEEADSSGSFELEPSHEVVSTDLETCNQDDFAGDDALKERFREKCGWWANKVKNWRNHIIEKSEIKIIPAVQENSGTGDRMMGLVGAFYHAISRNAGLDASWENLDRVFTTSCALKSNFKLREEDEELKPVVQLSGELRKTSHCVSISRKCDLDAHIWGKCPLYNRACMSQHHCSKLSEAYGTNLTMAHVLGCPSQILLSPKPEFLDNEVAWFNNGKQHTGPFRRLLNKIKEFTTLAIHIRSGDGAMHYPAKYKERALKTSQMLKRCSRWIDKEMRIDGKETKWIIATDNDNIRSYFKENFPNKTISLAYAPQHLNAQKKDDEEVKAVELMHLFAEWYLIGKADKLLTNKAHHFGLSSFSRSAWLYNLKSEFYQLQDDRYFCYKREFVYEGNTGRIPWSCGQSSNRLLRPSLALKDGLQQSHWPTTRAGDTLCKENC